MDDWQRDPCKYVRQRLRELSAIDADRVAFGRQQRAFSAASLTSKTEPSSLSVDTSVANPTDKGEHL
jgi:hypothetical protein